MTDSNAAEHVLQLLTRDGSVAREVILEEGELEIGRVGDGFTCPDDEAMADRHARLNLIDGKVTVVGSGKGSGVWLRIKGNEGRLLRSGDQVWLGAQILVVHRSKNEQETQWKIRHHGPDGLLLKSYPVPGGGLFVGRNSDLILDADDFRLSRRHAQLVPEGDRLRLYDRGAHNGTHLKLSAEETLADAGEFTVSANRFRVVARGRAHSRGFETDTGIEAAPMARRGAGFDEDATVVIAAEPNSPSGAQRDKPRRSPGLGVRLRRLGRSFDRRVVEPANPTVLENSGHRPGVDTKGEESNSVERRSSSSPESSGGSGHDPGDGTVVSALDSGKCLLVLDFETGSQSLEVTIGKTVLEAVQEAGLARGEPVDWECGDGGCGVCVMGVVEGADRLDPPDPATGEMRTIQITEQVVPDPRKYRLACLARVRGTVRLRKLN
jgi:ferredoxin